MPLARSDESPPSTPIAIGGIGGSGTRVFASTIAHMGIPIGTRLNRPLDNLWFTVLFKRPQWTQSKPSKHDVVKAVDLFRRAMTLGLDGNVTGEELELLNTISGDLAPTGSWSAGADFDDAQTLIKSKPATPNTSMYWGWKEPNTHVFLRHLDASLTDFRYIHIMRDGLDMAFSKNTWQTRNWAHLYELGDEDEPMPVRQLRYWLAANKAAVEFGSASMGQRFLLIKYEDFCANPAKHWDRIQRFLKSSQPISLQDDMVQATTIGRSAQRNLSIFPPQLLDAVQAFQSELEQIQCGV